MTEGLPTGVRNDPWTWVGFICAVAFALLAVAVNERGAIGFDDWITAVVQALPVPTDIWLALTEAGAAILIPIGAGVVATLVLLGRVGTAFVYGAAMLGASAWTHLVKGYVARIRPPEGALVPAPGFSFPSGHTLNSTVTYGLIALLVWRSDLPAWVRLSTAAILTTLVILIGLSRVALGVHYPSDVVGGWLSGVAIVAVVAVLTRSKLPDRP